jgi:hypothetical protein
MKRTLRFLAVILFLLAVIGVFAPLTNSSLAYADGSMPIPTCKPGMACDSSSVN